MAKYKSGGGGSFGRSYYENLAASRLGLTLGDKNYGFLWDDFSQAGSTTTPPGWLLGLSGTGSGSTNPAGTKGGVHRKSTGTTAASFAFTNAEENLIANVSTDKWWFGVRQAVPTAVTVQTLATSGLYDGAAKTVQIGVFGPSGGGGGAATNFSLQYDGNFAGSFANLGVPIDTAMHFYEVYCKGDAKLYYRTDEGAEGSVTPAAASALSQFLYSVVNVGTDVVNRVLDTDFVACLFPR